MDSHFGEYQGGLRKGRTNILSRTIIPFETNIQSELSNPHRLLNSKKIVVIFVDSKKANETIDKIILEFGVISKLANQIRETLTHIV